MRPSPSALCPLRTQRKVPIYTWAADPHQTQRLPVPVLGRPASRTARISVYYVSRQACGVCSGSLGRPRWGGSSGGRTPSQGELQGGPPPGVRTPSAPSSRTLNRRALWVLCGLQSPPLRLHVLTLLLAVAGPALGHSRSPRWPLTSRCFSDSFIREMPPPSGAQMVLLHSSLPGPSGSRLDKSLPFSV